MISVSNEQNVNIANKINVNSTPLYKMKLQVHIDLKNNNHISIYTWLQMYNVIYFIAIVIILFKYYKFKLFKRSSCFYE